MTVVPNEVESAGRPLTVERLETAVATALRRMQRNLLRFGTRFPAPASVDGEYPLLDNVEWTSGFWSGMLWLAYEFSGDAVWRELAEQHVADFRQRIERKIAVDHHDLGFLYTLSCVSAWQLTGSTTARDTALRAAEQLMNRFLPVAGIIQAWGDLDDPAQRGRMIIDCNMNLPLLYWAARETQDLRYAEAANRHLRQAARLLVRDDASTFHTYYLDPVSGAPLRGDTHQGHSDRSCWARGQAWGIYGFSLAFRHTGDPDYLKLAKRLADYFLEHLPADRVCYWDLCFTSGPEERDSSAAAIAVCGLAELCAHLPWLDVDRPRYESARCEILSSLLDRYAAAADESGEGLLKHGVYHKPHGIGVDEACIWGDFFYLEALMRAGRPWRSFWYA